MATTSAPTKTLTYEQALNAGHGNVAHADDPAVMAVFCEANLHILVGAVSPQLVWEGAQKTGMTFKELAHLCNTDPIAVGELMWVENAEEFNAVLTHLKDTSS